MRGEELGGGGDLVGAGLLVLLEPGEDLVLPLRDVELVEPADDLDVLAHVLGQHRDGTAEDRVVGQQVGRDEQLGVVALALEHEGHGRVPEAAVVRKEQRVRLGLGVDAGRGWRVPLSSPVMVAAFVALDHVRVDLAALGRGQHLGLADLIGRGRDHADPGVAVGVHEPQRDDAVEPGVGDLVGDVRLPLVAAATRRRWPAPARSQPWAVRRARASPGRARR